MAEKVSALHAIYVIDGVQEEYTPAQLLDAVTEPEGRHSIAGPPESRAVDETLDPVLRDAGLEPECTDAYLEAVCQARKAVPAAGGGHVIESPLPGVIKDIFVKVGQQVKADDVVCILEAMKMGNEIHAGVDGTVKSIEVSKEDSVLEGNTIMVIG